VRNYKNSKRNILFRRDRDNFQTLISLKVWFRFINTRLRAYLTDPLKDPTP
jgi:hypothetical protein